MLDVPTKLQKKLKPPSAQKVPAAWKPSEHFVKAVKDNGFANVRSLNEFNRSVGETFVNNVDPERKKGILKYDKCKYVEWFNDEMNGWRSARSRATTLNKEDDDCKLDWTRRSATRLTWRRQRQLKQHKVVLKVQLQCDMPIWGLKKTEAKRNVFVAIEVDDKPVFDKHVWPNTFGHAIK